jgi:hypothetical protein
MSYIGNQPTSVAFLTDQFSGTGSQTAFTLSAAPANTASILVAVSGVLQDPTTYSTAGLTLTFSSAPPSGTGNISVRYLGIPASNITTTAYRTVTDFTATAGQTTFTPPSYTAGFINVYRNGARLGAADYTATNGTTVVLATGATSGDLVTTESFYVSSVLNAIPATSGAVTSAYLLDGSVTQAKLSTNVSNNGPAFSAVLTATSQSISANTYTKAQLSYEFFDTNNNFDTTNYRFTPTVAGYYQINAGVQISWGSASTTGFIALLYKNGAVNFQTQMRNDSGNPMYGTAVISTLVYMNGSTDYLELWGYGVGGTGVIINGSYSSYTNISTWMNGYLARTA